MLETDINWYAIQLIKQRIPILSKYKGENRELQDVWQRVAETRNQPSFKNFKIEKLLFGVNQAGNLLIPNENYCLFEDWLMPILDECFKEQQANADINWTPSKAI